jgi:hypothetical protein
VSEGDEKVALRWDPDIRGLHAIPYGNVNERTYRQGEPTAKSGFPDAASATSLCKLRPSRAKES